MAKLKEQPEVGRSTTEVNGFAVNVDVRCVRDIPSHSEHDIVFSHEGPSDSFDDRYTSVHVYVFCYPAHKKPSVIFQSRDNVYTPRAMRAMAACAEAAATWVERNVGTWKKK